MGEETTFEGWAILELMGHRRLAGYVQEVELAGHGVLRLDVPGGGECTCLTPEQQKIDGMEHRDECPVRTGVQATQFYSPTALYCLTPTTEEVARTVAARSRPAPVHRWELPPAPTPGAVALDLDALAEREEEESF